MELPVALLGECEGVYVFTRMKKMLSFTGKLEEIRNETHICVGPRIIQAALAC